MSVPASPLSPMPPPLAPVSRAQAFRYWLKLGFISFGGPAGQIAIMHEELVERRRWISERRFLHALNYCMVLPGPEAQQLATYIGWLMHGTWGGIVAGALFVLPSLFILIGLSWIYVAFGHVPAIAGALYGMKPAVTAIVLFAAYRIGRRALRNGVLWGIAAAAFVAIFVFDLPFPYIVLGAAAIGVVGGRVYPNRFQIGQGHSTVARPGAPALIDDDTPTPAHARVSWTRMGRITATGATLWFVVMAALATAFGWRGTFTQMGGFFTKAALLTFGGAYAVLPYVYQGAVEHYHWLSGAQMIDGLALGETTPGPLIMVVAFVGYVGGVAQSVFGVQAPFAAGALGAIVATLFTFLPSFLFILLGAPLIEATRRDLAFSAPLTAITAAVVGVIINLALFFAYHVLWPHGISTVHGPRDLATGFETVALVIGLAAAVALFRYKVGIIPVVLGAGLLGVVYVVLKQLSGAALP